MKTAIFNKHLPLLLFCQFGVWATAETLTGHVTTPEGNPIDYAVIRVSTMDSVFVKGAVADENGKYTTDDIPAGSYRISASCIGFETQSAECSLNGNEPTKEINFILPENAHHLDEVVVTSGRFIRNGDCTTVIPDKEQVKHSGTGFDLLGNLMIPGVSVNRQTGEVGAFGGGVSLYIDGMPADYRDIQNLRPADIERVQYFEAPSGKYAGDNASLNFITKKRTSGGYIAIDAKQRIGYTNGDYNLAGKIYDQNTSYTLFAGTSYSSYQGATTTKDEYIAFDNPVNRTYSGEASKNRNNAQYAQLKIRNKNDKRTLRAEAGFVRNATPESYSRDRISYRGLSSGDTDVASEQDTEHSGSKVYLNLQGNFNFSSTRWLEASLTGTYTANKYDYLYCESQSGITSHTDEDLYNIDASINYGMRFSHGNSLTFKLMHLHKITNSVYTGTYASEQRLWSAETILFGEYSQPIGKRASLRVAPGLSSLQYQLHGSERVSQIAPRLQLTFAIQPARNQFGQIQAFVGNSFPTIGYLNSATQQVDLIQLKRGNPELDNTRMYRFIAVYGWSLGKVSLQAMGLVNLATTLPITDYWIENQMLVQSYRGDGEWRNYNGNLSVTWMPSNKFNVQINGGYSYHGYFKGARASSACFKGDIQAAYYLEYFAFNAYFRSPEKVMGTDLAKVTTPLSYGLSASWTKNAWRVEIGTDNPFSSRLTYKFRFNSPIYNYANEYYSPTDRRSAYVKVAYSFDFGKKTKHDSENMDKSIESAILKAH